MGTGIMVCLLLSVHACVHVSYQQFIKISSPAKEIDQTWQKMLSK